MSASSGARGLIRRAAAVPAGAVALGVFGALLVAPPAAAVNGIGFPTPGTYTWTVPPGVFSAQFVVSGAAGGPRAGGSSANDGGVGGQLTATLYVTPGDTYTVVVGGRGASAAAGGGGGFNGGGDGGSARGPGAGGGGASDVRYGGTGLGDRVLVAGGGGGDAGSGMATTDIGAQGGDGSGGSFGGSGNGEGGQGGGPAGGGAGGVSSLSVTPGLDGQPGTAGTGGTGGGGGLVAGGGGGGGWYGGGGGASTSLTSGGGGGGGSGYADPSAVSVSTGQPTARNNGAVDINWTAVDPSLVVPTLPGVPPHGLPGTYYDFDFQATGFPLPVCSVTAGTPPPGIQLTSDCLLRGTPTTLGSYPFTVTAVNGTHPVSKAVSIDIGQAPMIAGFPPSPTPADDAYVAYYDITGYPEPTVTVTAGALPPGVTINDTEVPHLVGDPTVPGTYTFTLTASNGFGSDASLVSTIEVTPDPNLPTIAGTPPVGGVGEPYSFTFTTTGLPASTITAPTVALPPGLTLSPAGVLSGTPTTAGSYPFTLTADNGNGTATENVVLVVRPRPALSIGDRSVLEGNSGTRPLVFTVRLSRASTIPVTVRWHTANGTALAGSDYTAASGVLTFRPGQTTATLTVLVHGDRTKEPNETFHVRLTSPGGASIADGDAIGHILNDD